MCRHIFVNQATVEEMFVNGIVAYEYVEYGAYNVYIYIDCYIQIKIVLPELPELCYWVVIWTDCFLNSFVPRIKFCDTSSKMEYYRSIGSHIILRYHCVWHI